MPLPGSRVEAFCGRASIGGAYGDGHGSSSKDVDMEMVNSLASIVASVCNYPVTAFIDSFDLGYRPDLREEPAQDIYRYLIGEIVVVFFGDQQSVDRHLRVDILKGDHDIVFIDNRSRYLSCSDLAE